MQHDLVERLLSHLAGSLYRGGRKTSDVRSIVKALKKGSVSPIVKRAANKFIGKHIVSKMWFK